MISRLSYYRKLCNLISGKQTASDYAGWAPGDWEAWAALVEEEGVASLVYGTLISSGWPADMPASVRKSLVQGYYAGAARNALLLIELDRILRALSLAGIAVITLKGAALAREIYPDPAFRPMNDLDLMVRLPQIQAATQVIQECGYRVLKSTYHIVLQGGPDDSITVELHWILIGSGRESHAWQPWERAISLAEGNQSALRMHPLDSLIYLSVHLIWQHAEQHARLLWYYDLHLLLQRYGRELDWTELIDTALRSGLTEPLYQALTGVAERFGDQVPQGFVEALKSHVPLTAEPTASKQAHEKRMRIWFRTATRELPWDMRLRTWAGLFLPHPAYMRWRYHPRTAWLLPVYYPLRWWLLLREGLTGLLKD